MPQSFDVTLSNTAFVSIRVRMRPTPPETYGLTPRLSMVGASFRLAMSVSASLSLTTFVLPKKFGVTPKSTSKPKPPAVNPSVAPYVVRVVSKLPPNDGPMNGVSVTSCALAVEGNAHAAAIAAATSILLIMSQLLCVRTQVRVHDDELCKARTADADTF